MQNLKKQTNKIDEAKQFYDGVVASVGGCTDGYCSVTGKASGMHTNGGCRCAYHMDNFTMNRFLVAARRLRDSLE